jgi:ABC-type multidrug transport system ATPase subunit
VAKPALLLFLDEPTSGLDSQSAWSIVRFMRKLADSGQAILCTIHQPSSVLFEQFDRLLLLMKGGKTVYFGDIGDHSHKVIDYFESKGAFPCPPDANPAEYILDVIGAGATARVDCDWNEVWTQSVEHKESLGEIQALKNDYAAEAAIDQSHESLESGFAVPWLSQYRAVQSRLYLHYWRNPTYVMGKLFLNVVAGLFIGFTFYREDESAQGLQNKVQY